MTTLKEWMDAQWRKPGVQYAGHGVVYESGGNSGPPRTRAGTERASILEGNAMTDWQTIQQKFEDTQAAYFSDETTETARAYFFAALELWKENALDDCTIEFIAFDCGKHLGGNEA